MSNSLPQDSGDLLERLHQMLNKAGITDEQFVSGVRLTQSGLEKAARRLGVDSREIELLMRSLFTRIQQEQSRIAEMAASFREAVDPIVRFDSEDAPSGRYSYEVDYLKNVTIHDTQTGKSVFLRGTAATAILNRIAAGADEQAVLAQYAGRLREGPEQGWTRAMNKHDEDPNRERPHMDALQQTGFYGKQGSGCIVLAADTGRILLAHRSKDVLEPHTWGGWGGAIDAGEDPKESAVREVFEEAGYRGKALAVEPLLVFSKGSFRYHNFLMVVPQEFEPHLNWESQGSRWCEFGEWPTPLHPGLKALFSDAHSHDVIEQAISESRQQEPTLESVMESLREMGALMEKKATLDEDDSFHDEIHAAHGSYNFPWRVGREHGYATARYRGRGKDMKITILSIRDHEGEQIDADDHLTQIVHDQAVRFIGQE